VDDKILSGWEIEFFLSFVFERWGLVIEYGGVLGVDIFDERAVLKNRSQALAVEPLSF